MKRILISLGIFLGLAAILAVVLSAVSTDRDLFLRYMRTRNVFQYMPGNTVFDPVLGYRLTPRLNVPFNNTEFTSTVQTNSLGFRDDEGSLQNPEVLFLGDSYVWGWGVEERDGVEKQYEQLTGRRVLNLGVPGYGSIQELLMLYKWAKVSPPAGRQLFLFFCANDLLDNENTSFNAFPYLKESNGQMSFSNPTAEGYAQWQEAVNKWTVHGELARNSMLAYYCLTAIKNMNVKDIYRDYQTDAGRINGARAFMIVAQNLSAFCHKYQDTVTVVYVPPAAAYKGAGQDKSLALVQEVCYKTGFRFADLTGKLQLADYYPLDQHWKASAHHKAAIALAAMQ